MGNGAGKTTTMRDDHGVPTSRRHVDLNGMLSLPMTGGASLHAGRAWPHPKTVLDQLTYLGQLKGDDGAGGTHDDPRVSRPVRARQPGQRSGSRSSASATSSGSRSSPRSFGEPRFPRSRRAVPGSTRTPWTRWRRCCVNTSRAAHYASSHSDPTRRTGSATAYVVMVRGRVVAQGTSGRPGPRDRCYHVALGDLGWVEGMPGIATLERRAWWVGIPGESAGAEQRVLAEAVRRGPTRASGAPCRLCRRSIGG